MVDIFNEWGNPFTEISSDLLAVDKNLVMADEVVQSLKEAEDLGKAEYKAFVDDHMINLTKSIYGTIPNLIYYTNLTILIYTILILFKSRRDRRSTKTNSIISNMKSDLKLFSRMCISC